MLNNPADVLSIVLRGTLGRSGRKRARRATSFLTGNRGFLSTSALIGAAGVAWGIYDTVTGQNAPRFQGFHRFQVFQGRGSARFHRFHRCSVPPLPGAFEAALDPVARVIRLAVSAAKADGTLSDRSAR